MTADRSAEDLQHARDMVHNLKVLNARTKTSVCRLVSDDEYQAIRDLFDAVELSIDEIGNALNTGEDNGQET